MFRSLQVVHALQEGKSLHVKNNKFILVLVNYNLFTFAFCEVWIKIFVRWK